MVNTFAEDAFIISDQGKAQGMEEINEMYKGLFSNPKLIDAVVKSKHVYSVANKIYEIGTNNMIVEIGGNRSEMKGNYATVWEKFNGKWFITEDILPPIPE